MHFTAPYTLLLLALLCVGCDSFTDVELPNSQLAGGSVFENATTANAAMAHVYASIRDTGLLTGNSSGLSNQLGHYSDELTFYGASSHFSSGFYTNSLAAANLNVRSLWNETYNQIYACNAIIEGVSSAAGIPAQDRDRLTGEALFIRALLHFYLTGLYGDIPYIKTTDYKSNSTTERMNAGLLYENLLDDLLRAQTLLPENYSATGRVIPNRKVANALLARVYLYNGQWAQAKNSASLLINDTATYPWEDDLEKIFLKDAGTTLWQLMPAMSGQNTLEAANFIFMEGPPPLVALRPQLMEAFETGDKRRQSWTRAVSDGTTTWYHAFKYRENSITPTSVEYPIIFRLAEQYLIRAEASAHMGELEAAAEDLNVIRHNAGLENTTAQTTHDMIEAILAERRVELFTEHGHRFFDLKRSGHLDQALTPVKPGWNPTDALFPVPQSELLSNPNLLPQNPGY